MTKSGSKFQNLIPKLHETLSWKWNSKKQRKVLQFPRDSQMGGKMKFQCRMSQKWPLTGQWKNLITWKKGLYQENFIFQKAQNETPKQNYLQIDCPH